jgi:type I restriction enzyme R subunit
MSKIGSPERVTQDRVVKLFRDELKYTYLGDWSDRPNNSNVEEALLLKHLVKVGYAEDVAQRAIRVLWAEANNANRELYDNNKAVYQLLRYGYQIKSSVAEPYDTVDFIDWENPANNDYCIAEEVTLDGDHERRPDIVLYINGIAFGVIELKNSRASIQSGIRQNLSNQQPGFNPWFFSTAQFIFAGNDSQGLRYGTVLTPEKFYVSWKEDEQDDSRIKLDKYLLKMCEKDRMLELARDYVLFDAGQKKVPRPNQYFAVTAAQTYVKNYQGGVIWHTQGSGKSLIMVLLARWILRTNPNARVVVVTDRDELDKQIDGVFSASGEQILRTSSGADLMSHLSEATPRLMCSLIHKFGQRGADDFDAFIAEISAKPAQAVGEIFVFVDECHRTQSGKLHKTMKALLPGAVFYGFTGTPLLKKDAQTTREAFGDYVHTYKFREGVEDGVVLDFVYEARDVEQTMGSPERIDEWFETKTRGLNEWQQAELRSQWGTFQRVRSSRSRIDRIVTDISYDFDVKPLLRAPDCLGNAMLIASNIYEACRYYDLFQDTPLKGKVALVTSYDPNPSDVTLEETGASTETEKQYIYNLYEKLLQGRDSAPGKSVAETYRDWARELFVHEPARMRLLIVVDMCLTGFDPPDCTYEYIDKAMQDHGLFQAICRTNRVSGEWKQYGYIVDYKDLFSKVENSIAVYSSDLDYSDGGVSPEVTAQDRLKEGRKRLLGALEVAAGVCESVSPPKTELDYIHYFCGNIELPDDLVRTQPLREALYSAIVSVVRAYANIADDLAGAGFGGQEITDVKKRVDHYVKLRDTIKNASNEKLDMKVYEADMRHLIDTYIEAKAAVTVSAFDATPLMEIIAKSGILEAINSLPDSIKTNPAAVAETVTNNVRSTIVERRLNDPAYYDKMSTLLAQIVAELKAQQIEYAQYLKKIEDLVKQIEKGTDDTVPDVLTTPGTRALFNNLPGDSDEQRTETALRIDEAVRRVRQADWRGNTRKEQEIKAALFEVLTDDDLVESMFRVLRQQSEF